MTHYKLLTGLALGLLTACLALAAEDEKGETIEGTIMKVDPSAHQITVMVKEKKAPAVREFQLGDATKFIFFTGVEKKEMTRKEAYQNKELKEGAPVTVIADGVGRAKEVRVGMPPKGDKK